MTVMDAAQEVQENYVTGSQSSVRSTTSEDDILPVLTSCQNLQTNKSPPHGPTACLRYTFNNEKRHKHTSYLTPRQQTPDVEQHAPSPIHRVELSQNRPLFLPRLGDLDSRVGNQAKMSEDHEHVHFPEINVISHRNARFALNRSITDLLDPEMEILNKIKHTPRRKKRKRKQATPYPGDTVVIKVDTVKGATHDKLK